MKNNLFIVATAAEEALGTFEVGDHRRRSRRVEKHSVNRIEQVSLERVSKEIRNDEVEFIGFIKVEPVNGIKEEIMGVRPSERGLKKSSERIKELGGRIDQETAALVDEFQNVFGELPRIGAVEGPVKHHVKLVPGEVPQYPRQSYNLSNEDLNELKQQIKELVEKGLNEPTQAPFAAPVLLVPKPAGEGLRMVVNYKALNKITLKDKYPLP